MTPGPQALYPLHTGVQEYGEMSTPIDYNFQHQHQLPPQHSTQHIQMTHQQAQAHVQAQPQAHVYAKPYEHQQYQQVVYGQEIASHHVPAQHERQHWH